MTKVEDNIKTNKTDIVKLNKNGGVSEEYWQTNKKIVIEFEEGDNQ